jgi:hypothetical protein
VFHLLSNQPPLYTPWPLHMARDAIRNSFVRQKWVLGALLCLRECSSTLQAYYIFSTPLILPQPRKLPNAHTYLCKPVFTSAKNGHTTHTHYLLFKK